MKFLLALVVIAIISCFAYMHFFFGKEEYGIGSRTPMGSFEGMEKRLSNSRLKPNPPEESDGTKSLTFIDPVKPGGFEESVSFKVDSVRKVIDLQAAFIPDPMEGFYRTPVSQFVIKYWKTLNGGNPPAYTTVGSDRFTTVDVATFESAGINGRWVKGGAVDRVIIRIGEIKEPILSDDDDFLLIPQVTTAAESKKDTLPDKSTTKTIHDTIPQDEAKKEIAKQSVESGLADRSDTATKEDGNAEIARLGNELREIESERDSWKKMLTVFQALSRNLAKMEAAKPVVVESKPTPSPTPKKSSEKTTKKSGHTRKMSDWSSKSTNPPVAAPKTVAKSARQVVRLKDAMDGIAGEMAALSAAEKKTVSERIRSFSLKSELVSEWRKLCAAEIQKIEKELHSISERIKGLTAELQKRKNGL